MKSNFLNVSTSFAGGGNINETEGFCYVFSCLFVKEANNDNNNDLFVYYFSIGTHYPLPEKQREKYPNVVVYSQGKGKCTISVSILPLNTQLKNWTFHTPTPPLPIFKLSVMRNNCVWTWVSSLTWYCIYKGYGQICLHLKSPNWFGLARPLLAARQKWWALLLRGLLL